MQLRDTGLLKQACLIDGEWVMERAERTTPVVNPATGKAIGTVPWLGATETAHAVEVSHRALAHWQKTTPRVRARLLRNWYDLIIRHEGDLATLMTAEQGKPLHEARAEIQYAASFVDWFAEEGRRVYGDMMPANRLDQRILAMKQPVGVVAAITPWNFPAAMITRKCAPAIAAGCTVVAKPATETPFSALALAELACRAGIPRGVFNVVTGRASEIGGELTTNRLVRKLSFTGSTEVGKVLIAQCAGTVKKLSMELGGNAPFLVFDDADLVSAVRGVLSSKFRNTGQTCVCANRILVHEHVHKRFLELLKEAVEGLKVGDGLAGRCDQGPLINEAAVNKVEEHVADALTRGATLVVGGRRHALGRTFYEPTILSGVTEEMLVAREETFGPVAPVFTFSNEDEAIALANNTESGLAAYAYTTDLNRFWRVIERLEAGMVGMNEGIISNEVGPFGGIKQSGIGREGSKYGIDEFLQIKYVCLGGVN